VVITFAFAKKHIIVCLCNCFAVLFQKKIKTLKSEMNIELKEVHVGEEIKKRLEFLHMTKTEFGRRIGVPQQHINRILERDTMETRKLLKVCRVLDENFFAMFCQFNITNITSTLSALAVNSAGANVNNAIGDAIAAQQLQSALDKIETLKNDITRLEDANRQLKSQLDDKNELIEVYKNRR
jgi:transcriptional regulator with XRE-family HTH domain